MKKQFFPMMTKKNGMRKKKSKCALCHKLKDNRAFKDLSLDPMICKQCRISKPMECLAFIKRSDFKNLSVEATNVLKDLGL